MHVDRLFRLQLIFDHNKFRNRRTDWSNTTIASLKPLAFQGVSGMISYCNLLGTTGQCLARCLQTHRFFQSETKRVVTNGNFPRGSGLMRPRENIQLTIPAHLAKSLVRISLSTACTPSEIVTLALTHYFIHPPCTVGRCDRAGRRYHIRWPGTRPDR